MIRHLPLVLLAACGGTGPSISAEGVLQPIATGARGRIFADWCTSYSADLYHPNTGLGRIANCSSEAMVTSIEVTTEDTSKIQLGPSKADFRTLSAGTATLHVTATFAPGGAVTRDVTVTIVDAASGTFECDVGGSKAWRCDGTDPAMLVETTVQLDYGKLRSASGQSLDGHVEVVVDGVPEQDVDHVWVSPYNPGRTTVVPASPQLAAIFPAVAFEAIAASEISGARLGMLTLDSDGHIARAMPAEVTQLSLTEREEKAGGKLVPLVPVLLTRTGGWAIGSTADMFASAANDDVIRSAHETGFTLFRLVGLGEATIILPVVTESYEFQVVVTRG